MSMTSETFTPYADGTSGHQGHASEAAEPSRRQWQPKVRALLLQYGSYGATMREACDVLHGTHQSVSSALSSLHKAGVITRLTQTRDRCGVYVIDEPRFTQGRTTIPHRANKSRKEITHAQIETVVDAWMAAPGEHETHLIDRIYALVNGK